MHQGLTEDPTFYIRKGSIQKSYSRKLASVYIYIYIHIHIYINIYIYPGVANW